MNKFWYGYFTYFCANQLDMDLIGKEKYIKLVDTLWMDTQWWYWLAIWGVVSGIFSLSKVNHE